MMYQGFKESDKQFFNSRRRTILYLIHKYLKEYGYPDIAGTLKTEAILNEYEICDNIDLDLIFLEYCSYQQLKFGKIPNILKKIAPKDRNNLGETKGKQPSRNMQKKVIEDLSKEVLQENYLKETLSIKQVDSQNLDKYVMPVCYATSHFELSGEWKEFAETVSRSLIKVDPKLSFKDVVGNDEAIATIREAVILPFENPSLFSDSLRPWKSILLYGPPGCGKTLIAKALCSEIQDSIAFFNITSSLIISKWRGDSEKILYALFQMARSMAPSVIFFDEIECLTGRRNAANEHEASHRLKSEFLQQLDGVYNADSQIFVLANTNLPWSIDDAFLRRFEKKILIQLPSECEREKLLNLYLNESTKWSNRSIDDLKTLSEGFTGDEIRIACKEAKMKVLRKFINDGQTNKKEKDKNMEIIAADCLIDVLKTMKPSSTKLYEKHFQWQEALVGKEQRPN